MVYEILECLMVLVLKWMEMVGIKVDCDMLLWMFNVFVQKMVGLEVEIYEMVGWLFNVGSFKQLGEILFDELFLLGGKKGKIGVYVIGVDVFEDLVMEYELFCCVLDWCQLFKLKLIYIDVLQDYINFEMGCVYMFYFIVGVNMGCLVLIDLNL